MTDQADTDPREVAARALCELRGHSPDASLGGRPMWMSYLDEVDTVLAAVQMKTGAASSANDNENEKR